MLSGHNIIYFAPGRWHGLWRNRQQLMSIFAMQNTVLYVESRLSIGQTITYLRRGNLKLSDFWQTPIHQVAKNLFVLRYPLWAPASSRMYIGHITRKIRRLYIQYAMRKLHMSDPIVWFALPSMIDLVPEIPSARLRDIPRGGRVCCLQPSYSRGKPVILKPLSARCYSRLTSLL